MVQTQTTFTTSSKALQAIYDGAYDVLVSSVKPFGERRILTTGAEAQTTTLNTEVMGTATLSRYDIEAAFDTVKAFLATVREDGRFADSITCRGGAITPRYSVLTGLCFAEEALGLYYLTRKKDNAYLDLLLRRLLDFDAYLWAHHDLNFNHCLEVFSEAETEEGAGSTRFMPLRVNHHGDIRTVSPFPVESADLMACDVSLRHAIAHIYSLKGDAENAKDWTLKAIDVQTHMKTALWVEGSSACFDRDYRGSVIEALSVNNLFMMYYGAFDRDMADGFVERYLSARDGFGTAMPLPTVARGNRYFENDGSRSNFNGQPRGSNYFRAIGALEKYGHLSLLTRIGNRLLTNIEENGVFAEQFDPFTGVPAGATSYMPTAAAVLEIITRFFGVRPQLDRMLWGALGHGTEYTSEYRFTWGSDTFRLSCESQTSTGYINDDRLFTVTNGVRVVTDIYGDEPKVINVTDEPIDCVLVYRDRTFSFTLAPDESWKMSTTDSK